MMRLIWQSTIRHCLVRNPAVKQVRSPFPPLFAPPIGPLPHLAPFSPRPPFSSPPIPFIASTGWPADLPRDPSRPGSLQSERNEKPSPLRFLQPVGRAAKLTSTGNCFPRSAETQNNHPQRCFIRVTWLLPSSLQIRGVGGSSGRF